MPEEFLPHEDECPLCADSCLGTFEHEHVLWQITRVQSA